MPIPEWTNVATATGADANASQTPNAAADGQTAADQTPAPKKDDWAATRYQISREREMRVKAEKERAELEKQLRTPAPTFDADSDPDGKKERDYLIQQGIKDGIKDYVKDLGLDSTLEQIQYEREQEAFFKEVEEAVPQFRDLGIEAPSREELKQTLEVLDKKGLTREQLIMLTKSESIIGLLKPKGFAPGEGGKPTETTAERTPEQRRADLYRAHGAFGYEAGK